MQAVQFLDHGDRDVITYDEASDPVVGRDEALLDVKAGALNHLDVWTRRGLPGLDLELPHIPGSDAAGIVREVGADVTRVEPGDRVAVSAGLNCGTCEFCRRGDPTLCVDYQVLGEHTTGVHSELATVAADALVPVPEGVDWATAAGAPLVFQTAWRLLVTRGEIRPNETVLVLGASGGVGHAAVQIAAHAGCEVFATASTAEKRTAAERLGADHTIDYTDEDFASKVRELTDKRGVDVVVDHVGAATWRQSLGSLAHGGRLLTCGATTGPHPETAINRIFANQLRVIGSTMASYGEAETARGHELLETRRGFGKVIVVPDTEYEQRGR